MVRVLLPLATAALLAGCIGGGESAEALAAKREAEGKAVGGGCRHAGRAIEDCFALNKRADKAAVFAGWREMNDYMRDNKVETVAPQGAPAPAESVATTPKEPMKGEEAAEAKPAKPKKS